MPTYVYETTDETKPLRRFEVKQSMNDAALRIDPETGEPVRRVISGGYGYVGKSGSSPTATSAGSCGSGCGCC